MLGKSLMAIVRLTLMPWSVINSIQLLVSFRLLFIFLLIKEKWRNQEIV